jgi:hypothetical protein
MTKIIAASLLLLLVTGGASQADVRSYFAPAVDGNRLDACLTGVGDCGKPAADAFCKGQGFETAILFQRQAATDTKRLGSGESCSGAACTGFRQIKCYTLASDAATAQN